MLLNGRIIGIGNVYDLVIGDIGVPEYLKDTFHEKILKWKSTIRTIGM